MPNNISNKNVEDNDLLLKLKENDKTALAELYVEYHKVLYTLALKYLKDTEMAKDAVQSVFLKLWESRQRIVVKTNVGNYLYSMLKNKVLNDIRNSNSAIQHNYKIALINGLYEDDFSSQIEKNEMSSQLMRAIQNLPAQKRKLCFLKLDGDKTNNEIAGQMKIATATVKSHFTQALKDLRRELSDEEDNEKQNICG